ncbi:MAG TPA: DUF3093 domain-containing protein [Brevibacterium senegalense]|uniref:DUF3093 domain-containing protein n=1 Tax=Brevibacterium senegalense TaxID=1033736 RepID=A0A921SNW8_9MICO|nr:DUF3093 domain-containing protein [Brevibacterium senegalense]
MAPVSPTSSSVVFRERVTPSAGWWIIALSLSAMTSLLALPLTPVGAALTPLVVGAAVVFWMLSLSTRITVTDDLFAAGRAHIERAHITGATAHDEEESFAQRGRLLDARAFLILRPWAKTVVRVEIDDPADPTPYWLVSTRRADELAAALDPARD